MDFTTYRILCSTPPDLEAEQTIFLDAVAAFGEEVTVPARVLFATASFRRDFDARLNKAPVESNIRFCDFFVGILPEDAADPAFTRFIEYAVECAADPTKPMRKPWVYFRNTGKPAEAMSALRNALAESCEIREFRDPNELASQFRDMLSAWYAGLHHRALGAT